jgi:hypothetical protein
LSAKDRFSNGRPVTVRPPPGGTSDVSRLRMVGFWGIDSRSSKMNGPEKLLA